MKLTRPSPYRALTLIVTLALISIALLYLDRSGRLGPLRSQVELLIDPALGGLNQVGQQVSSVGQGINELQQLREGIAGPVNTIVAEVRAALEETPPELVADIMEYGIVLAGGGALLHGLDRRIAAETKMPVHIAEDPLSCVARGAGKMVEEFENPIYRSILTSTQRTRRVRY